MPCHHLPPCCHRLRPPLACTTAITYAHARMLALPRLAFAVDTPLMPLPPNPSHRARHSGHHASSPTSVASSMRPRIAPPPWPLAHPTLTPPSPRRRAVFTRTVLATATSRGHRTNLVVSFLSPGNLAGYPPGVQCSPAQVPWSAVVPTKR